MRSGLSVPSLINFASEDKLHKHSRSLGALNLLEVTCAHRPCVCPLLLPLLLGVPL